MSRRIGDIVNGISPLALISNLTSLNTLYVMISAIKLTVYCLVASYHGWISLLQNIEELQDIW